MGIIQFSTHLCTTFPTGYDKLPNMENVRALFRKGSIMTVLLAILLIVATSSILSLILYNHYYAIGMMEIYQDKIEDDSMMIQESIERQIRLLQLHASTLGTDASTGTYLTHFLREPDNILYHTELSSYAADTLNELQLLFNDIMDSAALIASGEIFSNYLLFQRRDEMPEKFIESLYSDTSNNFIMVMEEMENPIFTPSNKVIPIVFRYNTFGGFRKSFLVAFISSAKLSEFIASSYLSYFDGIEIRNVNGELIYSAGMDDINQDYSILQYHHDNLDWVITIARSNDAFKSNMRNLFLIETALLFLILMIASTLIFVFYQSFTEPLKALMGTMLSNSQNREYHHAAYNAQNEIGTLTKCYNAVIDEVENLVLSLNEKIDELEEEKKQREWEAEQKRLAEIKALQAQINPHFLYNALNSIVWMTTDNGDDKAAEFTLRLADYYHTSLSRGEEFIPLSMEIKHAKDYIWLQGHRYEKIISSFTVACDIEHVLVPKIILQPLLENAIYHGLKPVDREWKISVHVYKADGSIMLSVYDNGAGIPEKRLEILSKNLHDGISDSSSGYGIYNINNRLKLTYGKEYGLSLYSKEGFYTLSVIKLPAKEES